MKLTFLGTASYPSKERNSQGILIETRESDAIIVDCGEGIQRQMEYLDSYPLVNAIFLTHEHIDHITGLPGLVMKLYNRFGEPTKVYGPKETNNNVKRLLKLFVDDYKYDLEVVNDDSVIRIGELSVSCFRTFHMPYSLGYHIKVNNRILSCCGDLSINSPAELEYIREQLTYSKAVILDIVHSTDDMIIKLMGKLSNIPMYIVPYPIRSKEYIDLILKNNGNVSLPDDFESIDI